MAGIATAAELAANHDVCVLEQELQPGYHSTGRSAAVLHLAFENDVVHRLTRYADDFYRNPPDGFSDLCEPISHIAFDTPANKAIVHRFLDEWVGRCPWLKSLNGTALHACAPLLQAGFDVGMLDDHSLRLDVDAILQAFRQKLLVLGGEILVSRRVDMIEKRNSHWEISAVGASPLHVDVVINAAGAWADQIAEQAGIEPLGIQPRRRTGVIVNPDADWSSHPMCYRASGGIYFKTEGPLLMVSPADATDSDPCDAQPEELDVAMVLDTLCRCTTLQIDRPVSTWAGLRSFAADGVPVIGFDTSDDQFFWVAALGGFGIQTAPAYARIAAELIEGNSEIGTLELSSHELGPGRLQN